MKRVQMKRTRLLRRDGDTINYRAAREYDMTDELANDLIEAGDATLVERDGIVHVGGGVYQLPNGKRVRGKEAAEREAQ